MFFNTFLVLVYVSVFFMPFSLSKCTTRAKDEKSPFGVPAPLMKDRLPTKRDVGAFYMMKRAEMEAQQPRIPTIHDVATKVVNSFQ